LDFDLTSVFSNPGNRNATSREDHLQLEIGSYRNLSAYHPFGWRLIRWAGNVRLRCWSQSLL